MKKTMKMWSGALLLGGVAMAGMLLPAGCTTEDSPAVYLYEKADVYRGGKLYDEWFEVADVKEGIEPGATVTVDGEDVTSSLPEENPLYAAKAQGADEEEGGPDTWRCAACHGFTYDGEAGFPGILGTTKSVTEIFDIIKNGTGVSMPEGHAYAAVLSDQDIADLVKFVKEGAIDTTTVVSADGKALGDPEAGKPLFDAQCAKCHGPDGKKINFHADQGYTSEYLYNVAADESWELIHKVRFGSPDGEMPTGAVKGYVLEDVANILAYAQTLAPKGFETASLLHGGVLYDTWWEENDASAPTETNPGYTGSKTGAETWRCKECHGWDYKGKFGIPSLFDAQDWEPADLIAAIGQGKKKDGSTITGHDFEARGFLSSGDVADLAFFVKTGLVDDEESISYVTLRAKGSPATGHALWETNCETCHGDLGTRINFHHDEPVPSAEYVGTVAREDPFELIHKIRWGQPGSDAEAAEMEEEFGIVTGHMPNAVDAGYSEAQIASIIAYAQTLPTAVERGGMAWDKWWEVRGVAEPIQPGGSITDADGNTVNSSLPATNPLYPTAGNKSGPTTWRCKECHGWDYKGKDGVYGTGSSHYTGIKGVFDSTMTADELYNAIANGDLASGHEPNHVFKDVLGDAIVRDLVTFLTADPDEDVGAKRDLAGALVDSDPSSPTYKQVLPLSMATDPGRTREASYNLGRIKYEATCAQCHGTDGHAMNFAEDEGEVEFVSTVANDNPWEFVNKVMHGQPGSEPVMINAGGQYWDLDDVADILLYAQDLP